jgi:hypothetical protein
MHRAAPAHDQGDEGLEVGVPTDVAAGVPAVLHSVAHSVREMGIGRSLTSLLKVNQADGFDCPGCAWPDPRHRRSKTEFCENGAKHVSRGGDHAGRSPAEFFARTLDRRARRKLRPLAGPAGPADRADGASGPGRPTTSRSTWDEAYGLVADELGPWPTGRGDVLHLGPHQQRGRLPAYQLMVSRAFGTNNLPDCSNMCHESSGCGPGGDDRHRQGHRARSTTSTSPTSSSSCGQNPGTNHPRMLSGRSRAKANGARIVAVNPLPEAGLFRFKNPQRARGVIGRGTEIADQFLRSAPVGTWRSSRPAQPAAARGEDAAPGTVLDHDFIAAHTDRLRRLRRPRADRHLGARAHRDRPDPPRSRRSTRRCWPAGG